MILGLKLLKNDGESLNDSHGRVKYPADGSWVTVPGNGAYVARTGGLTSGGFGPTLAVIECDDSTRKATDAPAGVECFGRVRRVPELEVKLKAYSARDKAYAAWAKADAARAKADADRDKADAAWAKADAAWDKADAAWGKAYAARDKAYAAWAKAYAAWAAKVYPWLREQEAAMDAGRK